MIMQELIILNNGVKTMLIFQCTYNYVPICSCGIEIEKTALNNLQLTLGIM